MGDVDVALTVVTLVAIAIAVTAVSERITVAAPLVLIVVGIAASYLPFVPDVELTPEIVLAGLLPPLCMPPPCARPRRASRSPCHPRCAAT